MLRFHISREDWSLHRQGQMDQERHMEKIKETIKGNLGEIVSTEPIITSDGQRVVRVPVRSLNEYRFRYNWQKQEHAGQGDGQGGTEKGDVIAQDPQTGQGQGGSAGDQAGEDWYESEMTLDELGAMIFDDLSLPHLDEKRRPEMTREETEWKDVRKQGIVANLDKKRTILEAIARRKRHGEDGLHPIRKEDLRYRTWDTKHVPVTAAVVLAMMDTSGSMGAEEKYICRAFFFWMVRFLRTKYAQVRIVFIVHTAEAQEVTEEEFFTKGESGGTRCSSAYQLALEIISARFSQSQYNLYAFHFSDGDNLSNDNPLAVEGMRNLLQACNLVGYGEIGESSPYYGNNGLLGVYEREIKEPRFAATRIKGRNDVYAALRAFFGPQMPERSA